MDYRILIFINLIFWSKIIYLWYHSSKIEVKLTVYRSYLLTILFFVLGILFYFKEPSYQMIVNFISFSLIGFILNTIPNGISKNSILVYGKIHYFTNIYDVKIESKYGENQFIFKNKHKSYLLYLNDEEINLIKQYFKLGGKHD